jgi:hypothetical protein
MQGGAIVLKTMESHFVVTSLFGEFDKDTPIAVGAMCRDYFPALYSRVSQAARRR